MHSRYDRINKHFKDNLHTDLNQIPEKNAHPNIDYKDRIALFHNGLIANYNDLLAEAKAKGVQVGKDLEINSITDS